MSLETLYGRLTLVVGIITALLALWRWTAKPLRDALNRLRLLDQDMGDLLWERLQQGHDEAMQRGWCSAPEKERLTALHRRYTARGRNHLAASYETDLLRLPEHPGREGGEAHVGDHA